MTIHVKEDGGYIRHRPLTCLPGIFTIHVKEMMASGPERQMKLNLVDLAGMESSKKSAPVSPWAAKVVTPHVIRT